MSSKKKKRPVIEVKISRSSHAPVNNQCHYGMWDPQPIQVIEAWRLGFNDGNAIKYIARYRVKGTPVQDLEKAVYYLKREIEKIKAAAEGRKPCDPKEIKV